MSSPRRIAKKMEYPSVHGRWKNLNDLPDINVWLALAIKEHPHHQTALNYWNELTNSSVWFCRVTMLGFVRLLTQPAVVKNAVMTAQQGFDYYQHLLQLPNVGGLASEPSGVERSFHELLQSDLPARFLTDAFLAAFATAGGYRLVTFDGDFERFEGLDLLRLKA